MVSQIPGTVLFNGNVNKEYIHNVTLLKFIQNLRYKRCSERNTQMNVFELFLMEGGEGGGSPPLKISPAYKEQSFPKGGLNSFLEKEG